MTATDLSARLGALVDRFAGYLRLSARRHGLDDAEVDDAVQEVRLRLWRALERDASRETDAALPTSYVVKTILSAVRDVVRRRSTRRAEALPIDAVPEPATADDPLRLAERRELGRTVAAALATLIPSRRVAVQLYLSGCDKDEIARLLGWSEGKARNLLYRGLADLREALRTRGIEAGGETWSESA